MTPRTWLELTKKIRFEDQEAHVIDYYAETGGKTSCT